MGAALWTPEAVAMKAGLRVERDGDIWRVGERRFPTRDFADLHVYKVGLEIIGKGRI